MNYHIIRSLEPDQLDSINFIPSIIIGFYEQGQEELFLDTYQDFKARFPEVDMIGCSSESNIYDTIPYVDIERDHPCIYICLDMKKKSYMLQLLSSSTEKLNIPEANDTRYRAIILSSGYSDVLEGYLCVLRKELGQDDFYGAVAGAAPSALKEGSIFYNGKYVYEGCLLWFIDQTEYLLKGISVHDFDPVGFELEITHAENDKIFEIENRPALDMIEDMIGTVEDDTIASFDHPFFISSEGSKYFDKMPLTTMFAIDRESKSITMYKKIAKGDKLKLAIPYDRERQEAQLNNFSHYATEGSIAFLFLCVAYKGHWGEFEPIYLMHFAKKLKIPFIGFHTMGEIGPLDPESSSVMQNQTLTLLTLSQR